MFLEYRPDSFLVFLNSDIHVSFISMNLGNIVMNFGIQWTYTLRTLVQAPFIAPVCTSLNDSKINTSRMSTKLQQCLQAHSKRKNLAPMRFNKCNETM